MRPLISIIVPVLNEESIIREALNNLKPVEDAEIIFVDGGSTDKTVSILTALSKENPRISVLSSEKGRGVQMNAGAKIAQGQWLLFLHADTYLPPPTAEALAKHLHVNTQMSCGAFTLRISSDRWRYRYLEWYAKWRCKLLKLPYGDHGLFITKSVFESSGGFREDYSVMEDVEYVRRINRLPGFVILNEPAYTSARRFETDGFLKRSFGNLLIQFLYTAGVHPKHLVKFYTK